MKLVLNGNSVEIIHFLPAKLARSLMPYKYRFERRNYKAKNVSTPTILPQKVGGQIRRPSQQSASNPLKNGSKSVLFGSQPPPALVGGGFIWERDELVRQSGRMQKPDAARRRQALGLGMCGGIIAGAGKAPKSYRDCFH